jgi:hypothetical protein
MSRTGRFLIAMVTGALVAAVPLAAPVSAGTAPGTTPVVSTATTPRPQRPHPHRKPWPTTITVRTVPALPGLRVTLDGVQRTTDARGVASWTHEHNFSLHVLNLVDTKVEQPDRRYRFVRWSGQRDPGQAFRPTVTNLPMRRNYTITAAFSVQYPVQARFVDEKGQPLDLDQIAAVRVKSDSGQVIDFPRTGPIWLDGTVPLYNKSRLVESDVSYSLQSVMMGGTNIVDAGRQKFMPARAGTVTLVGQFHDLTVRAHDALSGGPIGQQAKVTYPDGTVWTGPFGPDHSVTLWHLPRGTYTVSVLSNGMVLSEQFTLSRDKALDVAVLSRTDLVVFGAAGLVLAVGLLFLGRARLRRFVRAVPAWVRRQAARGWRAARLGEFAVRTGTRLADRIPNLRRDRAAHSAPVSPAPTGTQVRDPAVGEDDVTVSGAAAESETGRSSK